MKQYKAQFIFNTEERLVKDNIGQFKDGDYNIAKCVFFIFIFFWYIGELQ